MELADINLLDLDRFTEGVPHDWFTYLRANAPVYRHPEPDGPGFWVITKHADVTHVGKDGRSCSRPTRPTVAWSPIEERAGRRRRLRRRQAHADDRPARAHAVPQARQPRVHAADDQPHGGAHPRPHQRAARQGVLAKEQVRLRGRGRGRAAAARHRRAHRRARRGPPQDLRLEQPHGRQPGPRVPGRRTRRCSRPRSRCSCTRGAAGRGAAQGARATTS